VPLNGRHGQVPQVLGKVPSVLVPLFKFKLVSAHLELPVHSVAGWLGGKLRVAQGPRSRRESSCTWLEGAD
jgi:hypothetical protein